MSAAELQKARQSLLDLTMRNRLLNYRQTALRSIRVAGELPSEMYEALVLREKTLEFRGTGARVRGASADDETWRARATHELESRHTDRYLQTPYDDESLAKKLFRVYHEARSAVEEQGYTVLHLAIGFLEWFESEDSDQPRRAPLVLVPVELERVRAGDFSKVRWTGEDVFANISLAAKLAEHGIALPPFEAPEDKGGIDAWLEQVVGAIARKPRWRVLSEMSLDFFSFTKFVMFKDLDPATWPADRKAEDHPLLRMLFQPGDAALEPGFAEGDIDLRLTARDLWHVRDADPSQIAVIEDVKAGRNLVVEGPPGTGKSQTITNLIAEVLAAGKTVLFVSEKMAALEVVKARLDEAGLGPFCLELHSRKSNKKAVLVELRRSLGSQPLPAVSDRPLEEHEVLKGELNRYARELGTPVGRLGRSPFTLFGERERALAHFAAVKRPVLPLPRVAYPTALSEADVMAATKALRELAYAIPLVRPAAAHPWRHSALDEMLPYEEEEIRDTLAAALAALGGVVRDAAQLAIASGAQQPVRLADVERSVRAASILGRASAATETSVLLSAEWNAPNERAEALMKRVEACRHERAELLRTFHAAAVDGDLSLEFREFWPLAGGFFRIFNGRYRALRKQLAATYTGAAPKADQIVKDVARLVEHQQTRDALRGERSGAALFGARWQADKSDCATLRSFAEWVVEFRRELLANTLTPRAVDIASSRVDPGAVSAAIGRICASSAAIRDQLDALAARLRVEPFSARTFEEIAETLRAWQTKTSDLFRWAQFNAARKNVRATAAAQVEPLVAEDAVDEADLLPLFRLALAEGLLRAAFGERPALGAFVGDTHEKKIARFRELDADLVKLNQSRLSRRLHERRPQISGGSSKSSEAGILLGEFNRRRGHMSIRKLLSLAGGLIQCIKPCFLMSPLSVAQFLDPRRARFDLIVFDEASQVRPEDAIGALLRGEQLVVMGDTQQLPPTSFFDHLAESDGDEEESDEAQSAALSDVESILHQCARSYPTRMLTWHYRSRHESLIAVSNLHFYENQLRIYPSSIDWSDEVGLHFVHLPQSVYDRGHSATNRIEAQMVAAAALEHYRRFPGKSLGIGTFNIKQQQAIREEIEAQLKRHPEMEPFFKPDRREPFFVKNLETIQGDERDVILVSIGYGRDCTGKLSANFGPVNREGGERRLNVLMSRARERCVIFSNFTAADLPPDAAKGLQTLRTFLEFAETRQLAASSANEQTEAPFEDAVAAVLRSRGYEVRQKVGCAGFRVDIAVIEGGRYVIGIECDGAKYHDSPVARDRDRLRQQILENLGWTIHRVWSTDWYRNGADTIERMVAALEEARKAPRRAASGESEVASRDDVIEPDVRLATTDSPVVPDSPEVPSYEVCTSLRIPIAGELHQVSPEYLAIAVEDIVRVEGPVHLDEVVRRLRTIWGLQRAGNRIRDAIESGVRVAVIRGLVAREGKFLRIPNATIAIRRRNGDPPARIDLISDAEVAEAVRHVLRTQFATPREELVDAAARRLGIQLTSSAVAARVDDVITTGVASGWLRADGPNIQEERS